LLVGIQEAESLVGHYSGQSPVQLSAVMLPEKQQSLIQKPYVLHTVVGQSMRKTNNMQPHIAKSLEAMR